MNIRTKIKIIFFFNIFFILFVLILFIKQNYIYSLKEVMKSLLFIFQVGIAISIISGHSLKIIRASQSKDFEDNTQLKSFYNLVFGFIFITAVLFGISFMYAQVAK